MFIYTTGAKIKTVVNTKHFTRILRINFSQKSLFLYIHFFGISPDATRTQDLARRCTRQFLHHCVAGPHTTHTVARRRISRCSSAPRSTAYLLLDTGLYSAVSLLECTALFQTTLSASFSHECRRSLWWSNTLECPISFSHGIFLVAVPLNWHCGSRDVRGITGCILLGAAASGYSTFRLSLQPRLL